ncbi:hypothetical protein [Rhizobium wuzhouense]|uniref:DUF2946 domain-containing protein n=1 Tax=Rhizobium wuzhouense TaxID=1986026 RepID=A0ABX5NW04_9HYPH|nr:hypothetical protein [Rhizobium wuzhouense]PYB77350.1 hypothetical protein DMY87_03000 [Rhizobium wuzhouense]
MKSLVRLLLLVAALSYGAMPMTGMPAMAMPVAFETDHAGDEQKPISAAQGMASIDCPHSGGEMAPADPGDGADHASKPMTNSGHCAACLTLPASPLLRDSGKPARAAEAASAAPRLVSTFSAPLTPPPRA